LLKITGIFFSHSSGGWKSEIKVLVELVPFKVSENNLFQALLLSGSSGGCQQSGFFFFLADIFTVTLYSQDISPFLDFHV
jgi:hypothetical protein